MNVIRALAPSPLRFDLIFILLDKPDQEHDLSLTEHVLALHHGQEAAAGVTGRCSREGGGESRDLRAA